MNVSELLNSATGQQIVSNISSQFGLDQNQAVSAVQAAVPMILGGLGRNAQTPEGAEALNSALESKHDGSVLDNIQGFFGNSDAAQQDGSGILGHIFGNQVEQVQSGVSQSSGISMQKIGPIIAMLAPIVLGYLSKQKQNNNVTNSGGLGDLIGGLAGSLGGGQTQSQGQGGGLIDMVSGFLDKNKDGNVIDDIMGMFGKK
ncbi:hypothetical protein DBR32_10830 [Taibaiella sp. KBW10]|uniref:DUF937 domain-containing protein n=1 Tax=Taibaiella sp. KBW10 TaxID=2153357 RepID=UPI000F59ACDA|nr:DUF937 domain-containing protein [Taibaiella sp. KBW10]RQO30076.1 hypothetical protein DBR32_10830 [Taibaiella sp. KBW10]